MKVIEHLEKANNPLFSYEIVPPPRGRTVKEVVEIVEKLAPHNPPWIDVTAHSAGAFYNINNILPLTTSGRRYYFKTN